MKVFEDIQAAIDKLTAERDAAGYGETNGWLHEVAEDTRGYGAPPYDDPRQPITNDPIIVTLYRTIDAQLAILEVAVAYGALGEGQGSRFILAAKTLAHAINGATQ